MDVSTGGQWAVLGVLAVISVISMGFWVSLLPKYSRYRKRMQRLNKVNEEYEELRKRRKDLVFHYFWAIDSGSLREAGIHEKSVIDIDTKLVVLKNCFKEIKSS